MKIARTEVLHKVGGLKISFLLILFILSFCISSANASLIITNWLMTGDGLLTFDTSTGLEWLDWSYTQNRSYVDVSTRFVAGEQFEGFRYATLDDITNLYTNSFGFPVPSGASTANIPKAQQFTSLFGNTFATTSLGGAQAVYDNSTRLFCLTAPHFDRVCSGSSDGPVGPDAHWATTIRHDGLVKPLSFKRDDFISDLFTGHALVRTHIASTVIPEPSTLALFSIGAIGMFGFLRKRRNKSA